MGISINTFRWFSNSLGSIIRGYPIIAPHEILRGERPKVTIALIVVNVLVYLISSIDNFFRFISDWWVEVGSYVPLLLLEDPTNVYRVLTSMFLHGDILHIFFNMYFLYIFGRSVENSLGSLRFLILYFMSGFFATVFHTAFSYLQGIDALAIPALGASGAISGVLGAYLLLYPGTSLSACWFFFIFPVCFTVRAAYWLIFWFATQVIYGYARVGAAIAFFAHAGGFVTGIALMPLIVDKENLYTLRLWRRFGSLFNVVFSGFVSGEGLGKYAKALMAALITSLVIGSAIMAMETSQLNIYLAEIDGKYLARVDGRVLSDRLSDELIFAVVKGGVEFQRISNTYSRILINRLVGLDLLVNSSASKSSLYLMDVELQSKLRIRDTLIYVPTYVYTLRLDYDEVGLLRVAEGSLKTAIVRISDSTYSLTDEITYDFRLSIANQYEAFKLTTSSSIASLIISTMALLVTLFKDRDLTIVG